MRWIFPSSTYLYSGNPAMLFVYIMLTYTLYCTFKESQKSQKWRRKKILYYRRCKPANINNNWQRKAQRSEKSNNTQTIHIKEMQRKNRKNVVIVERIINKQI